MTAGGRFSFAFVLLVAAAPVLLGGCSGDAPSRDPAPPLAVAARADGRPTFAVLIVVDQFRADYLTRFAALLDGGLARLKREGFSFEQALHGHATTQTSPGHASLATGLPPARHGIIGNRWFDRRAGAMVGCVVDPVYPSFAGSGGVSPELLQAPTLGEWIKKASPQSRVVAVSGKETASTLLAGRKADGVFWYDRVAGRFTTSRYYAEVEPEILTWFAGAKPFAALACRTWERLDGPRDRPEADPDQEPWEGGVDSVFPHHLPCGGRPGAPPPPGLYSDVRITPFLDDLTLDLAEASVDRWELGRDGAPDLLAISLSATDFVGHRYGPDSQETLDQVRRLDRRIGTFLERLDAKVGLSRTLVVLTADHGATSCPERDEEHSMRRVNTAEFEARIGAAMAARLGAGRWLAGFESNQVYLTDRSSRAEQAAIDALSREPAVAGVYRRAELEGAARDAEDPYLPLMRASWTRQRGGDLMIRLREGWLINDNPIGGDHGNPYPSDMRVPLIFRGPGIAAGSRADAFSVYRVAPSIARLLGEPFPSNLPEGPLPLGH